MFTGKNILVTGASRGIGRGVAEYLLKNGASVVLVARGEEKLRELVEQYPNTAYAFPYDMTDLDHVESIFEFCKEKEMKLDGMFYSVGISENCMVRMITPEMAQETFDVNYFSLVQLGRFFSMKKYTADGASAVVMSSAASKVCEKAMSQYSASKAAVNAYVKVMAKEVMKRRVRVNAIAPVFVDTDMLEISRREIDDLDHHIQEEQPLGIVPVEQIVNLAEFLLSDKSAYITGAVIPVFAGGHM